MEPIEVLGKFVGTSYRMLEPWRATPFLAEPEFPLQDADTFWSVGTCGHTLMAYKGKLATRITGSPKLPFLWTPRDPQSIQVSRKELLEWTGVTDTCLIGFNDKPIGLPLQGKILTVAFDLRKLAHLMDNYPSEKLYVWESTHVMHGVKSLAFDSEDGMWRGVLAGLDGDPDPKRVFQGSGAEYDDVFRMMLDM
jgi:hypothetical protein